MFFVHPLFGRGAGGDPDAAAYRAAMTTQPTEARSKLIEDFFVGLKTDGLWSDMIAMYSFAAHTQQAALINARQPGTYNGQIAATGGGGGFTTDKGFNAVSIQSNFPILTNRLNASVGVWLNYASGDYNNGDYVIASNSNNWSVQAGVYNGGQKYYTNMYGIADYGPGGQLNVPSPTHVTLVNDNNTVLTYKDATLQGSVSGTPNTPGSGELAYFAGLPGGNGYASSTLGFAYIGRSFTKARLILLNDRIKTYLTGFGGNTRSAPPAAP